MKPIFTPILYSIEKYANNKIFADMAIRANTKTVAILDDEFLSTSKVLRETGYEHKIFVIENDHTVFKKQLKIKEYNVRNVFMNINRFFTHSLTNVVYFDYMGSIRGSSKVKPLEDILRFLKKSSINDVYFALTVVKRVKIKYTDGDLGDEILDIYLKPCFAFAKREILDYSIKTYRRTPTSMTMLFFTFHLRYNADIEDFPFLIEHGKFVGYNL